jgi:hypothetical protein
LYTTASAQKSGAPMVSVAFCSLHRDMPEQELNLFKLTAVAMTQLRTGRPQVVRCNVLYAGFLAAGSDHVPDNVLRYAAAPHLSQSGDRSKDFAIRDIGCACPLVEGGFDPVRNGDGANVATLADQINHCPVPLAHLDVVQLQANQFRPSKATTEQHGQHRIIALGPHSVSPCSLEHFRTLLCAQPMPDRNPSCLTPLTRLIPAANSGLSRPASAAS